MKQRRCGRGCFDPVNVEEVEEQQEEEVAVEEGGPKHHLQDGAPSRISPIISVAIKPG